MRHTFTPAFVPAPPDRIWRFVLLSLLLHLLLLWGLADSGGALWKVSRSPRDATDGMALQLLLPVQTTPEDQSSIPVAATVMATETSPPPKSAPAQQVVRSTPESNPTPDGLLLPPVDSGARFNEQIIATLQRSIAAHVVYPPLAQRRNWQGKVVLSINIGNNGWIQGTRVAHSSGYGVLDRAALTALRKIQRLPQFSGRDLTINIPVIYRLEE